MTPAKEREETHFSSELCFLYFHLPSFRVRTYTTATFSNLGARTLSLLLSLLSLLLFPMPFRSHFATVTRTLLVQADNEEEEEEEEEKK